MNIPPTLPEAYRDRFEPLRVLGQGVSGRVYEAIDRETGRTIAVKVPVVHDLELLQLTLAEELDNRLSLAGPGIAEVLDWRLGSTPFVVMEVLRGGTLGTFLGRAPVIDVERALDLAMQWLVVAARMIARRRYTVDFHYNNALFERSPDGPGPWRAAWTDVELCFPTRAFGFYAHFPQPNVQIADDMPLRGLYWGFNTRDVQRIAVELVLSLCAKLKPRPRFEQARDVRNGASMPVSAKRLEPYMPAALARYLSDRSTLDRVPFAPVIDDVAVELSEAAGFGRARVPVLEHEPGPPDAATWPKDLERVLDRGGVCRLNREWLYSDALHACCVAREAARGSWLFIPARPLRRDLAGSLSHDCLILLRLQNRLSPSLPRKVGRVSFRRALAAHAAWVWHFLPQFAEKLELPRPEAPFSRDPSDTAQAVMGAVCALREEGRVPVLAIEDPAAMAVWDREVLERVCAWAEDERVAILIGENVEKGAICQLQV